MVKNFSFIVLIFIFANHSQASKVRLSQKNVAEMILKNGLKAKEINLQYEQNHLAEATVLANYDYKLSFESGFENDKTVGFSPSVPKDSRFERYKTAATLSKPLTSGTTLGLEINRLSQKSDINYSLNPSLTAIPAQQTQDSFGFTLSQSLWGNSFGLADRALVSSAKKTYQALEILRADDLENLVLTTIRQFWDASVAEENFKQAIASRDRTKKLLDAVQRKTSLGYSNPGELAQARAEFETREQNVKSSSTDYLQKEDDLLTSLGLQPGTEIEYAISELLPALPKLPEIKTDELRQIRSQKLKAEAAAESLSASKSKSHVYVDFVGKVYSTGSEETSEASLSSAAGGTHPKYYAGLKLTYSFGSGLQNEDIINKKAAKELEESKLARSKQEVADKKTQSERKVQSTYSIAQSAFKLKEYRDKAVTELQQSYNQGRTDIRNLIDAMNNYFTSEVQLSRAIGDYQISLNELAAQRDELISETKENKP